MSPATLTCVQIDQRAYHVRMAEMAAGARARIARQRAHDALDAEIRGRETASGRLGLYHAAAEAREWLGIAAACSRELSRLARLKWGTA